MCHETTMFMKRLAAAALVCLSAGCSERWPDPPAIDQAQYQTSYTEWRDGQEQTARESTKEVGIWPLQEGETAFGSDASLPIALPVSSVPPRAGIFHRAGETVTVTPARGVQLRVGDGNPVTASAVVDNEVALGSIRMSVIQMGDGRQFVSASDEEHPLLKALPAVQTYPVEMRWRVAARFDAFEKTRMMPISDIRGGSTEYPAVGRLSFRVGDQEQRLTAFQFPESNEFFLLFKDATNATTTYGFRIVGATAVKTGEWTVIDFNVAGNPPCAYSQYTTCPLPPAENRLAVAIEAGEKRFPTGRGFVQQ
jgi:uncharacterized protein (DUF1684 family)